MTQPQIWLSIFTSAMAFFLALGGWIFVYYNTNRVAKRAEVFSLVGKAVDKAVALDRRCADFWLSEKSTREQPETWIAGTSSELHSVRAIFELLEKYHGFEGKKILLSEARQAATLDAESVTHLDIDQLYQRRGEQVEVLNKILNHLYDYYRIRHD